MQTEQMRGQSAAVLPPHNLDAEEAVLGAILISKEAAASVIEIFSNEPVFYKPSHNLIFHAACDLFQQSQTIDVVTISEELEKRGELDRIGGVSYLHGLAASVPTAAAAADYAQIVRDKYLLRRLIETCREISTSAYTDEESVEEILDRAEAAVFSIADMRIQKSFKTIGDILSHNFEELERLKGRKDMISGLSSGFTEFDRLTTGLQPGDLCILAARPSVGKTAFALNMASHLAIRCGKRIAFFSLEMSREALVNRVLCSESRVSLKNLRSGFFSDRDWRRLTDHASQILDKNAQFHIDDSSHLTVLDMRAKARRLAAMAPDGRGLDLIIVDYLQMVVPTGRFENRQLAVAEISRGLKRLAKELRVPVVALSQLSRRVEERSGMRPQLSDLRESGSLEQDADLVVFLHRDDSGEKKQLLGTYPVELIIGKQRNGPVGAVNLVYISDITRFENYIPDTRVADVGATV